MWRLCREQPLHRSEALVDVVVSSGLNAIRQVLEDTAPGIEDGAFRESRDVVDVRSIAANGDAESAGAKVAVEQPEVAGRIDDGGIAPVDDAGHRPRDWGDEHGFD